ncbi:MAG: metal-dependent transcriptional regulator [Chloroflexota bacterium]
MARTTATFNEVDEGSAEISSAMRDYLAEIYRIGLGKMWVSTTAIAENLEVSGPAAVRMVRRLQSKALVEHLPYKGVSLTEVGKKEALLGIRRHRLVERFLVDVLKFDWADSHAEADILDKGINQRLEDKIDEIMNFPSRCPHGDPIPSKDGVMPIIHDRPLTVTPAGTEATVSRIRIREPEILTYIAEIGLVPGASFKLLSRAPFNGPLRLQVSQAEQVVSAELAAAIWVECTPDLSAGGK